MALVLQEALQKPYIPFPKGPCTHIVYTCALKPLLRQDESSSHGGLMPPCTCKPPTPIDSSTRCVSGARRILSPPSEQKSNICLKQRGNSSAGQATENALPRTPRPPLTQDMQVRQNFLPPDALTPLNMNRDPCKFPARQHFRAGVCLSLPGLLWPHAT